METKKQTTGLQQLLNGLIIAVFCMTVLTALWFIIYSDEIFKPVYEERIMESYSFSIKIKFPVATYHSKAIEEAVAFSNKFGVSVEFELNGLSLMVNPGSSVEKVNECYRRLQERPGK